MKKVGRPRRGLVLKERKQIDEGGRLHESLNKVQRKGVVGISIYSFPFKVSSVMDEDKEVDEAEDWPNSGLYASQCFLISNSGETPNRAAKSRSQRPGSSHQADFQYKV